MDVRGPIVSGVAGEAVAQALRVVTGLVTDQNGEPYLRATVVCIDRDLRSSKELGRSITDASGAYKITYGASALLAGQTAADIQLEVLNDAGQVQLTFPILFNAPDTLVVNLALGGPAHAAPSEHSSVTARIAPMLGSLQAFQLEENNQYQDVSFVSGQTGIQKPHVAYWTIAARMAASTQLSAELFYGLLRRNIPTDAQTLALASSAQGVDLDGNAQRLLNAIFTTRPDVIEKSVQRAIDSNVIPPSYSATAKAELPRLQVLAQNEHLNSVQGMGKTSIGSVLTAVGIDAPAQLQFVQLYTEAAGQQARTFWNDLIKNKTFTTAQVADMKFGVTVGRLTRGHLPLITQLTAMRRAGTIVHARDLARYTAAQWQSLLNQQVNGRPIGAPTNFTSGTAAAAVTAYATFLEGEFTRTYPTPAFSARIAADQKSPFAAGASIAKFIDANPAFDLTISNIDVIAKKTKMADPVRQSLCVAQRLTKLHPSYAVTSILLSDGIHSARQVYFMGKARFTATYGKNATIGPTQAARIFGKAEQTYGVALAMMAQYNLSLTAGSPTAIAIPNQVEVAAQLDGYPNLQTLFGSDSYCACEECQSVLGAAAYLVDLLEFLKNRTANDGTPVRDALLSRRIDLAQIELTCANTNTALPYIDLVNELLEDAVAPPADPVAAARGRQTTLSTPELNANPQWVNPNAYPTVQGAVYPWILPFDLSLDESRTYLGQLGVTRTQLLHLFSKPWPDTSPLARLAAVETLGFTALAADVITAGTLASGFKSWDYWGLAQSANTIVDPYDPTKSVTGTWIDVLSPARVLLNRAGLSYQELARLLNTFFINFDGTVTIQCNPPDSCDIATMTISGLTQDVLDRLHRFVRLWRRLGWNVYDLDDAIWTLQSAQPNGLGRLNDQLLRQLAVVTTVASRYDIEVRQAVALLATIPTRDIPTLPGDDPQYSLYHDLFENLTILNPTDSMFQLNPDGTEIAGIASNPQLSDHTATLVAALQISNNDLATAIAAFTNGKLTLANLCTLYKNVQLAQLLSVSIDEFITLLAVAEQTQDTSPYYAAINPFGAQPEALTDFIDAAGLVVGSAFSIQQLDFILRNVSTPGTGVAPDPVAVGTMLLALWNGLVKIATQTAFKPDPTGTATRKELAKFLTNAGVNTAMAIMAGTSTLTTVQIDAFITSALGPYMNAATTQSKLAGGTALAAGEARYEYVLQSMLQYDARSLGTGLIIQTLSGALGIPPAVTSQLVVGWFPSAKIAGKSIIEDFLAIGMLTVSDPTVPIPPTDPNFAPYFAAYAALAKTALLITSFKLSAADVAWWQQHGVAAHWIDPTTLPATAASTAAGRFAAWARLGTAVNVTQALVPAAGGFTGAFSIAGGAITKSACFNALATMAQWPGPALATLAGDPANVSNLGLLGLVYPDDFACERAIARLAPCFKLLQQYGFPADVTSWIGSTVASAAADAIKQAVKANYPLEQWLTLAKQLRDPLREAQRDALVGYLLAHPPAGVARWLDPEDVFGHFLIDVEMCSCQATSRIVQANNTVQLFVQRCFLNLEHNVTVDLSKDDDWSQWVWMNQYRLWEANREVFLFPENYYDPTLRKSPSSFFTDMMNDLKQGDLTDDLASTALSNYLEKLEAVARLDVCGTFQDFPTNTFYVVARSQGVPPIYYIRQWIDSSHWTPWSKIDLDIASDHILPVMWNGRLYLFWAIVTTKADSNNQPIPNAQSSASAPPGPNLHAEVQLAWSQFKQNKWQAKQTAPQTLVFSAAQVSADVTLRSLFVGETLEIDIYIDSDPGVRMIAGAYVLGGAGNGVQAFTEVLSDATNAGGPGVAEIGILPSSMEKPDIALPTDGRYDGDWIMPDPNFEGFTSSTRPRTGPLYTTYNLYGSTISELVLNTADYYRLVVPHQIAQFDSSLPFFYRDPAREYFCVPTIYFQNGNYFTTNAPAYVYHPFFKAEYTWWPFYHAFVPLLVSRLNMIGLSGLFDRNLQLYPATVEGVTPFNFGTYYNPTANVLKFPDGTYPAEGIDFDPDAGYSIYNWELFFHAPLMIANALSLNQHFDDAKRWYEYIFNPSAGSTDSVPQRFWITAPFYLTSAASYSSEQINNLMQSINSHDPALEHQVAQWRSDPFDPDMIAQMRTVAYQRATVMKYINNLMLGGDMYFRMSTLESINIATQLYVLAEEMLGPAREVVQPRVAPAVKTYADLEGQLDSFSNAAVAAENVIPPVRVNVPTPSGSSKLPNINTLYFRIPPNQQLLDMWTTVNNRLDNIRHCRNIEGLAQQLPLFAPPINPALLVAATAAGLDLSSVLSDIDAPLPPYRFATMIRQAKELCASVQSLGTQLLSALEKSDAEQLARIRSSADITLQNAIEDIRNSEIDAANQQIDALDKAKQSYSDRYAFYNNRALMNDWEATALILQAASLIPQAIAIALDTAATVSYVIPDLQFGASGFGGTPMMTVKIGGQNVGQSSSSGATVAKIIAATIQTMAQTATALGQYTQRQDAWGLEAQTATDELARLDSEIKMANYRLDAAKKSLKAQVDTVNQSTDVDAFLHSKFTNQELYDWMTGETSATYFQTYQLAYASAKAAEQCFRRELAITDSSYIQFGYWDSLRQGLTAGDKLEADLQRLDSAYYTLNTRELEITKHVSLAQVDPYALLELINNHKTTVALPELLFSLDNPQLYMLRLKTLSVSVPAVISSNGSVSMSVSVLNNSYRATSDISGGYDRTGPNDTRFVDDPGGSAEIVTSSGQNDSGMFEFRLEDERYLPFEGMGAICSVLLELNNVLPQFDYTSITDVILHLKFTARDGGQAYATAASTSVRSKVNAAVLAESRKGLYRMFSSRHDYSSAWARFFNPGTGNDQVLSLDMAPERFPFYTSGMDIKVASLDVLATIADAGDYTLVITPPGGTPQTVTLPADATLNGLHHWATTFSTKIDLGHTPTPVGAKLPTWSVKLQKRGASDFRSLTPADIEDLVLIAGYQIS